MTVMSRMRNLLPFVASILLLFQAIGSHANSHSLRSSSSSSSQKNEDDLNHDEEWERALLSSRNRVPSQASTPAGCRYVGEELESSGSGKESYSDAFVCDHFCGDGMHLTFSVESSECAGMRCAERSTRCVVKGCNDRCKGDCECPKRVRDMRNICSMLCEAEVNQEYQEFKMIRDELQPATLVKSSSSAQVQTVPSSSSLSSLSSLSSSSSSSGSADDSGDDDSRGDDSGDDEEDDYGRYSGNDDDDDSGDDDSGRYSGNDDDDSRDDEDDTDDSGRYSGNDNDDSRSGDDSGDDADEDDGR